MGFFSSKTSDLKTYRRVIVSDLHAGHELAKVDAFLTFLDGCAFEELYLAGDMFDDFLLKHFPRAYVETDVARVKDYLHGRVKGGAVVLRFAGNHDLHPTPLPWLPVLPEPHLLDAHTLLTHGHHEEILWRAGDWLNRLRKEPVKRMGARGMPLRAQAARATGVYRRLAELGRTVPGVDTVIHGHLHLPGVRYIGKDPQERLGKKPLKKKIRLVCLPDWIDHAGGAVVEDLAGVRFLVNEKHQVLEKL